MSTTLLRTVQDRTVKQVTERGYSSAEVARRLDVNPNRINNWVKKYSSGKKHVTELETQREEKSRLRAELKRISEEHDI